MTLRILSLITASVVMLMLSGHSLSMSLLRADPPKYYQAPETSWTTFKQRFISDGRVIDTGNNNISHTEGQGWAMLMAEHHGDRESFDALWSWTKKELLKHHSGLFSWRYDPNQTPAVSDLNNASDGDVFIAWALLRAGIRWHDKIYVNEGTALRNRIANQLVHQIGDFTILLPGREGFQRSDGVIINLSYWVMPAFKDFAAVDPGGPWQALIEDGERLLQLSNSGDYSLPADWMLLSNNGELSIAEDWPPRFGFEGVRIPLYFSWAGKRNAKALQPIRDFWEQEQPAWVNVVTGDKADYPLSAGGLAIRDLVNGRLKETMPQVTRRMDYYASSLMILSQMAAAESPGN